MTFPTATFTATDLAVMIPEVWGAKINDFYRAQLVMGGFFTDRSDELANGGDILHTPNLTEMAASAKSNATAVTLVSPTETKVDLTVNQHYEVSFMIEDKEAVQVLRSYSVQERYAKNAAFSAAKKLEVAIATLFNSFSVTAGSTTTALSDANVLAAISSYTTTNGDYSEAAWFLHPKTVWTDLMAIDKFSLVQNTAGADPVMRGAIGFLYGQPVYSSTNLTTINTAADYSGALANPDAIHWAAARLPGASDVVRVQSNYMPDYLGTLTTADILYGVIENRDSAGVEIISAV